jgi:hypothetical protein
MQNDQVEGGIVEPEPFGRAVNNLRRGVGVFQILSDRVRVRHMIKILSFSGSRV